MQYKVCLLFLCLLLSLSLCVFYFLSSVFLQLPPVTLSLLAEGRLVGERTPGFSPAAAAVSHGASSCSTGRRVPAHSALIWWVFQTWPLTAFIQINWVFVFWLFLMFRAAHLLGVSYKSLCLFGFCAQTYTIFWTFSSQLFAYKVRKSSITSWNMEH